MLDDITPVVLTYNESANIGRSLEQLTWARRVVVVDSGSADDTCEICRRHPNVTLFSHEFSSHAEQWNWALEHTHLESDWVMALDADYILTPEFVDELRNLDTSGMREAGFSVTFRYCVLGRPLRQSLYPAVIALYRRNCATYFQDGHTQRLALTGLAGHLRTAIMHDDRKPLSSWLAAQDRYAKLECAHLSSAHRGTLSLQDKLRTMIVVTPFLVPLYCLFVRGLVLDGLPGWLYAFQRGIAEAILAIKLIERRLEAKS